MRRLSGWFALGLGWTILVSTTGCRNDAADVRTIAKTFMEASECGDNATAQTVVTEKAREYFTSEQNATKHRVEPGGFQVGDPVIQENTASVPVTVTDEKGTQNTRLLMRREKGKWLVYAASLPTYPGGPTVTMDFENPMAIVPDAMHAAGVVFGQMANGMEKGAHEFARGFEQGYGKPMMAPPSPGASIEEVPAPPTAPKTQP